MEEEKKKKSILVIEDEMPLIKAIRDKLYRNDFDVISARSVNQALGLMDDVKSVDAIWLDHYLLGTEDGLDFVKKIKSDDIWKNIPIFVVSNTASSEKVVDYHKYGVTKFFTKANFRLDEIVAEIQKHLK
jgi:DNA-binding NtrC family response regulator